MTSTDLHATYISTSDTYATVLHRTFPYDGEVVRYFSEDLPGVLVDHYAHEDGNRHMVEVDLTVAGVIGEDAHHETFLVAIDEAHEFTHALFSGLLS